MEKSDYGKNKQLCFEDLDYLTQDAIIELIVSAIKNNQKEELLKKKLSNS